MALDKRPPRVTGAQVAREAGVDPAVVSKLLKGDSGMRVSAATRKRVEETIQRLNYRPSFSAQRLRSQRVGAVGLVIPDFRNPAYGEIIHGAEQASLDQDVALFVTSMIEHQSPMDVVVDLVASQRIDALLVAAGTLEETSEVNDYLAERKIPFLFLNRQTTGLQRSLFLDDENAMQVAVDHLVDLGHTEIRNIAGLKSMETGHRRQRGFEEAMRKANLGFKRSLMAECEYSIHGGEKGFARLMTRTPRPTAIVVSEFVMGVGALSAARKAKLDVPGDVSIVVFNDLEIASYLNPTLTTVSLPLAALGAEGLTLLVNRPANEPIHQKVEVQPHLIPRESTQQFDIENPRK